MCPPYGYRKPPADLRPDAVAFLAVHYPAGLTSNGRYGVWRADGTQSNLFAVSYGRDDVACVLAANGFELHSDNSITLKGA